MNLSDLTCPCLCREVRETLDKVFEELRDLRGRQDGSVYLVDEDAELIEYATLSCRRCNGSGVVLTQPGKQWIKTMVPYIREEIKNLDRAEVKK